MTVIDHNVPATWAQTLTTPLNRESTLKNPWVESTVRLSAVIQALCQKYGLFYNTGCLFKQYWAVMARILTFTLPPKNVPALPS
ncbi:MAG: hypothetical protein A3F78_05780 [Burkholderiales bacterium RIFCSPLOWO2_12_FULL_61_40]|nr:MAG: hypothetical protein A3F78_05780 [Burkholderiales bacterium RIFCSPLOWO2_12_FULL_61_40]